MDLINNSVQTALRRQTCIKHVDTLRSYFRRSHSTLVATNTARDIGLMTRDLLISAKSIGIAMSMFHCRSLPISRKKCPSPTHSPAQFQQMHMCARACMHDCAMPLELKRDCVPVAVWMHSPRGSQLLYRCHLIGPLSIK